MRVSNPSPPARPISSIPIFTHRFDIITGGTRCHTNNQPTNKRTNERTKGCFVNHHVASLSITLQAFRSTRMLSRGGIMPPRVQKPAREKQRSTKRSTSLFHHYFITITKIYNENHNQEEDTALFAVHYQLHTSVLTGPHTVECLSSVVGSTRRTSSSPHYDTNAVTKHRQTQERANEPTKQPILLITD